MEVSAVDMAFMTAENENFDEVIILGLHHDDGLIQINTSMEYTPDVYFALQMAARLMLEQRGQLND